MVRWRRILRGDAPARSLAIRIRRKSRWRRGMGFRTEHVCKTSQSAANEATVDAPQVVISQYDNDLQRDIGLENQTQFGRHFGVIASGRCGLQNARLLVEQQIINSNCHRGKDRVAGTPLAGASGWYFGLCREDGSKGFVRKWEASRLGRCRQRPGSMRRRDFGITERDRDSPPHAQREKMTERIRQNKATANRVSLCGIMVNGLYPVIE
jgi:hypothetical protein